MVEWVAKNFIGGICKRRIAYHWLLAVGKDEMTRDDCWLYFKPVLKIVGGDKNLYNLVTDWPTSDVILYNCNSKDRPSRFQKWRANDDIRKPQDDLNQHFGGFEGLLLEMMKGWLFHHHLSNKSITEPGLLRGCTDPICMPNCNDRANICHSWQPDMKVICWRLNISASSPLDADTSAKPRDTRTCSSNDRAACSRKAWGGIIRRWGGVKGYLTPEARQWFKSAEINCRLVEMLYVRVYIYYGCLLGFLPVYRKVKMTSVIMPKQVS